MNKLIFVVAAVAVCALAGEITPATWGCAFNVEFDNETVLTNIQEYYVDEDHGYIKKTFAGKTLYLRSDLKTDDGSSCLSVTFEADGTCHEDPMDCMHLTPPIFPKFEYTTSEDCDCPAGSISEDCVKYYLDDAKTVFFVLDSENRVVNANGQEFVLKADIPAPSAFGFTRCGGKKVPHADNVCELSFKVTPATWGCAFNVEFDNATVLTNIQEYYVDEDHGYIKKTFAGKTLYLRSDLKTDDGSSCLSVTFEADGTCHEDPMDCMHLTPPMLPELEYFASEDCDCPAGSISENCIKYYLDDAKTSFIGLDSEKRLVNYNGQEYALKADIPAPSAFGFTRCGGQKVPHADNVCELSFKVTPASWGCAFNVEFDNATVLTNIQEYYVDEDHGYIKKTFAGKTLYLRSDLKTDDKSSCLSVTFEADGTCHEDPMDCMHLTPPMLPELEYFASEDCDCPAGSISEDCVKYYLNDAKTSFIGLDSEKRLVNYNGQEYALKADIPAPSAFGFTRCGGQKVGKAVDICRVSSSSSSANPSHASPSGSTASVASVASVASASALAVCAALAVLLL